MFGLLAPALRAKNAALAKGLESRFAAVQKELATLKQGDAYPNYETVDDAERQRLSELVAGLAKPLAQISDALGG
jgi:iron uptake system component EfeO